jgi:hypothetical protein
MGARSGLAAQVMLAIETTKNTRIVPTAAIPFTSENITGGAAQTKSKALRAGRRMPHKFAAGTKLWTGPISMELQSETIGKLLRLMFGTVNTTGAGPYTHTYSAGDLPSATVQIGRPESDSDTVNAYDYIGSMCRTWSLEVNPANTFVNLQLDLACYDEDLAQTLATPTYAAGTPLLFSHGALTVAGSALCFDTLTLNGDNALRILHKVCAADAGRPTISEQGERTYGGTFTADYIGYTAYQRFVNGTEGALVLAFNAGASAQLTFTGNVRYTGTTPVVTGPEVVKQPAPFEFMHATSDASALTVVLINTDTVA